MCMFWLGGWRGKCWGGGGGREREWTEGKGKEDERGNRHRRYKHSIPHI